MTADAHAARERKQKIFVVVGGLFFVALLAIQLPKLLGGSSSADAVAATTSEVEIISGVPGPTTTGAPIALVSSSASQAKITAFSVFAAKDPFVQQVVTQNLPVASAEGEKAAKTTQTTQTTETEASEKKFAIGETPAAAVTIVTVNGTRQVLQPGMKFPAADPLFVLVTEKPGSKSAVIGIAGGAYAGGAKTTTLKAGKPLTLVNTATGARYKIALVSVGSGQDAVGAASKP